MMYLKNKYLPSLLLGQTIGPFTSYRRLIGSWVLNKYIIYTRDDSCLEYLQEMGVKSPKQGRDLAFLQLPNQESSESILDQYKLKGIKYITIVPSGLSDWYTKDYDSYIQTQVAIINKILNNKSLEKTKIVLLAHVLKPTHVDDRNIIKDLASEGYASTTGTDPDICQSIQCFFIAVQGSKGSHLAYGDSAVVSQVKQ